MDFEVINLHTFSFRNVADVALLYAGSQRGKLDQISLVFFPLSFLLFTIIYWVLYLNESRKKLSSWVIKQAIFKTNLVINYIYLLTWKIYKRGSILYTYKNVIRYIPNLPSNFKNNKKFKLIILSATLIMRIKFMPYEKKLKILKIYKYC